MPIVTVERGNDYGVEGDESFTIKMGTDECWIKLILDGSIEHVVTFSKGHEHHLPYVQNDVAATWLTDWLLEFTKNWYRAQAKGLQEPPPVKESILQEAQRIIYGERQKDYGHPLVNARRIAAMWSIILGHDVTPEQFCLCMIGLKLCRLAHKPDHRDSLVDIPGYAAMLASILDPEDKPT